MRITTVSIILFLSISTAIYCDDYVKYFSAFITSNNFNELKEKKELTHSFSQKATIKLITNTRLKKLIDEDIKRVKPTLGVELVKLFPVSPKINLNSDKNLLMLYNLLHSLHTLKGITYYSATRKKRRILFYDSYVIDNPVSKNRMSDPEYQSIPENNEIYIFQNDSTFGKNIYSVNYMANRQRIIMRTVNLTTIKYMFLPLIKPSSLINYFVIVPGKESILFYGISFAGFNRNIPLIGNHIDSFYNRLKAMYSWFIDQFNKTVKFMRS